MEEKEEIDMVCVGVCGVLRFKKVDCVCVCVCVL